MQDRTIVRLARGFDVAGRRVHAAEIDDLTGIDEALLARSSGALGAAEIATRLIGRLARPEGAAQPAGQPLAAGLTIGDRERLLVAIAARTLGNPLDLVIACPAPDCAATSEIAVDLDAVLPVAVPAEPVATLALNGWSLVLRPATGDDQAALAAAPDPDRLQAMLVEALLVRATDPDGRAVAAADLPPPIRDALLTAIETLDEAAETSTEIACPQCGTVATVLIDGFALLAAGLGRGAALDLDVYRMARSFHWSEADILALPRRRRKRYLALAAEAEAGA